MTQRKILKTILLTATSVAMLSAPAAFAAGFDQFSKSAETSAVNIDYSTIKKFTTAFGRVERGRTKISYAAVEQQGINFLNAYMSRMSSINVSSLSRDDQLAYWLNTHNMLVMQAMVESNARRDMDKARGTPAAPGAMWTKKRITVQGTELSLHDIEKNIVVANFADKPNAVFGLYQGTKGGPSFPAEGFTGANLDAQLEKAGKDHVDDLLKVKKSKAQIPAVLSWYAADLHGGDNDALRAQLVSLSSSKDAKKLSDVTAFEARKFSYSSDELIIRQQATYDGGGNSGLSGGVSGGGGGGS